MGVGCSSSPSCSCRPRAAAGGAGTDRFVEAHASCDPARGGEVMLHVYDNGSHRVQAINAMLAPLDMGIYHCGLEVYGWEWSFSDTSSVDSTSGVFCTRPAQSPGFNYLESLSLGDTVVSPVSWRKIIGLMEHKWQAEDYHILRNNCYHFCAELADLLDVGGLPAWVTALASLALALSDRVDRLPADRPACRPVCCGARAPAAQDPFEVNEDPNPKHESHEDVPIPAVSVAAA